MAEANAKAIEQRVTEIAIPLVQAMGLELFEVRFLGSPRGRGILKVTLDSPNRVTVEECAKVSKELSLVLDVEDVIIGKYTLEVGSPGVNRPIRNAAEFAQYIGKRIKVAMQRPIGGRKNFTGRLVVADAESIDVDVEGRMFKLPIAQIAKANYEYDFVQAQKKE